MLKREFIVRNISLEGGNVKIALDMVKEEKGRSVEEALKKLRPMEIREKDEMEDYIQKITETTMKAMREMGLPFPTQPVRFPTMMITISKADYEAMGKPTVGDKVEITIKRVE